MKKLIKLSSNHYVIVDNSEIKEGDWYISPSGGIISDHNGTEVLPDGWNKITHSTQPLNCNCSNRDYKLDTNCAERNHCFDKIKYLSLQEVKELIGEVDVEKKVSEHFKNYWTKEDGTEMSGDEITADMMTNMLMETSAYKAGYDQALEDNKEKKYTEEDLRKAIEMAREQTWYEGNGGFVTQGYWKFVLEYAEDIENMIQSLQPKTDWEVEFVDGKLKLK